jgi:hypothetical protein
MKSWFAGFDRLEALKPSVIVPAHGAVGTGALIAENRAFMHEIYKRAGELKQQGRTIDEVVKTVTSALTAQHPDWPRANGIANAARASFTEAP